MSGAFIHEVAVYDQQKGAYVRKVDSAALALSETRACPDCGARPGYTCPHPDFPNVGALHVSRFDEVHTTVR